MGSNLDEVRRDNLGSVLRLVHRGEGLSRASLTALTGLNRSTVGDLVGELASRGLVIESEPEPTKRVGRPSPQVRPDSRVVAIAVNPEVDAVTVGVVGLGARVDRRVRLVVDHPVSPVEVAEILEHLLPTLGLEHSRVAGIGIAVPGLVRQADGLVRWAPHLEWTDAPVAELVRQATGLETWAANDASLGAMAEHIFGAGRGATDLVYLNGGASGIGGGFVVAGELLRGASGYAGEFGQNRPGLVDETDRRSTNGTLEDEVSRARFLSLVGLADADEPTLRGELLASSDPKVHDELSRQRRILAAALSNAINVFNPQLVLLGGFLSTILDSNRADLEALVAIHAIAAALADTRIEAAALGDDLLLIGAAELAFARLFSDPTIGLVS